MRFYLDLFRGFFYFLEEVFVGTNYVFFHAKNRFCNLSWKIAILLPNHFQIINMHVFPIFLKSLTPMQLLRNQYLLFRLAPTAILRILYFAQHTRQLCSGTHLRVSAHVATIVIISGGCFSRILTLQLIHNTILHACLHILHHSLLPQPLLFHT